MTLSLSRPMQNIAASSDYSRGAEEMSGSRLIE